MRSGWLMTGEMTSSLMSAALSACLRVAPQWCRRGPKESLAPQNIKGQEQQGGGTVMVWAAMSHFGLTGLVRVSTTMDSRVYIRILSRHLLPFLHTPQHGTNSLIFQQDGASSHTAKATRWYLASKHVKQLAWPAKSPDMSPIENLWSILKDRIWAREPIPHTLDQIYTAACEEWDNITDEDLDKLYNSMPRRIRALLAAKGWYTKY